MAPQAATWCLLLSCVSSLFIAGCTSEPVISDDMRRIDGALPADLSGSWERDYSRGDDVNAVLGSVLHRLSRTSSDMRVAGQSGAGGGPAAVPERHRYSVFAIARLADEITRAQVLTISQNQHEISIARKDDYALFCAFYNGVAKSIASEFGTEVCGWDGNDLVSYTVLPDGLQIVHRFTISADRTQLRVTTTVSARTAPVPFTLNRFYRKFEAPKSDFNCIETLSMKRVCSTGDIEL